MIFMIDESTCSNDGGGTVRLRAAHVHVALLVEPRYPLDLRLTPWELVSLVYLAFFYRVFAMCDIMVELLALLGIPTASGPLGPRALTSDH